MSRIFTLPGDISLTSNVVDKIREGCGRVQNISDPVGSIDLMTPLEGAERSCWTMRWFSRHHVPLQVLVKIEDIELALSEDTRERLRGKIVDFVAGKIVVRDATKQADEGLE